MKKRVLSMFMALALCLTLLPAPVRAAEDTPESGEDENAGNNADAAVSAVQTMIDALLGWFNSQTALLADAQSGEHTHCVCGKDSGTTVIPITTAQHGRQPIPCLILRAAII